MNIEKLQEMSAAELNAELNAYTSTNIKKRKMTKAAMIEELLEVMTEVGDVPPAPKKKRARKTGPSTKQLVRSLFEKQNAAYTIDQLMEKFPAVKKNTIETAIIDLKNPKYAGGEPVVIKRGEDAKFRVTA